MRRDCPNVYLEVINVDGAGMAIKFSPLEYAYSKFCNFLVIMTSKY